METLFGLALLAGFVWLVAKIAKLQNEAANRGADKLVCPHCQTRGQVTVRVLTRGKGISGGKATGALFTGGASMLATGLSKNVSVRNLTCGNCHMTWDVA